MANEQGIEMAVCGLSEGIHQQFWSIQRWNIFGFCRKRRWAASLSFCRPIRRIISYPTCHNCEWRGWFPNDISKFEFWIDKQPTSCSTSWFAYSCFKHFQARRNSGLWRKRSWGNSVYQHADAIAKASDPNIGYQFLTTSKWTHCLNVIAAGPFFRVSDFFWAIAIEKISAFTIEDFQNCRFGTINFKRTIESGQNEKMGFMISFIFPED